MLLAVIDLGSNSFKMTVAQYIGLQKKIPFKIVHKERHPIQLGGSVFESKKISDRHRIEALKALSKMKDNLLLFNMPLVRVVGTSALREARNGVNFVHEVERKLGLKIDVISGLHEARIIAQGLEWEYPFVEKGVLVDIGGGSTEVSPFGKGWKKAQQESFRLGSVRLALRWETLKKEKGALRRMREQARRVFLSKTAPKNFEYLVGSAGAIQSLGNILSHKRKNAVIHLEELDAWLDESFPLTSKRFQDLYGLATSRARVLIPGAIILSEALKWLGESEIFVTDMTLRNGLLVDFVEEFKTRDWLVES